MRVNRLYLQKYKCSPFPCQKYVNSLKVFVKTFTFARAYTHDVQAKQVFMKYEIREFTTGFSKAMTRNRKVLLGI